MPMWLIIDVSLPSPITPVHKGVALYFQNKNPKQTAVYNPMDTKYVSHSVLTQ